MRTYTVPLYLICILHLLISNTATAQLNHWRDSWKTNKRITSSSPNFYQRAHVGYTLYTTFATQKMTELVYTDPNTFTENEVTRTVRTIGGNGFTVGSYFILTRFKTDVIGLALSADYNYNKLSWEELDSGFSFRPKLKEIKPTDFTVQMGMPVSLDLILGSNVMPSRNHKWAASFGVGVYPMIAFTSRKKKKVIKENLFSSATAVPFLKVEAGTTLGVLMKLRLMILFGGPEYLADYSTVDGMAITELNKYSLTGRFSTNIGLIIYPFSYSWPEYGWWQ